MKIVISYDYIYVSPSSKSKRYGAAVIKDGGHHAFHMSGIRTVGGVPYGELRQEVKDELNFDIGALSKLQWHTCGEVGWSVIDTEDPDTIEPKLLKPTEKPSVYKMVLNPAWKKAMEEVQTAYDARVA